MKERILNFLAKLELNLMGSKPKSDAVLYVIVGIIFLCFAFGKYTGCVGHLNRNGK